MQEIQKFINRKEKRSRSTLFKKSKNNNHNQIEFDLLFKKYFIPEENKLNFKKYLIELFHDLTYLSSEEEKGVSHETFFFYFNIPIPIANNVFRLLDKDKNNYLNLEEFVFGIYDIYGNNSFNNLAKFAFDLYDTDRDGLITKDDIRLLLNYFPVDKILRNKYITKDYQNIKYIDSIKNQKVIEKIIKTAFFNEFSNLINFKDFIYIIKNKCSDLLVAVLIYLYEVRPFNEDVINIYSYTDYDYLGNNKNNINFKSIENIFKTKYNNNDNDSDDSNYLEQKIEMPFIDLNLNFFNHKKVGRYTRKNLQSLFNLHISEEPLLKNNKKLKSTQNILEFKFNSTNNNPNRQRSTKEIDINYKKSIINEIYTQKKIFNKNIYNENNENLNNKFQILNSKELLKLSDIYYGNVFKITKKGKLKVYYLKLIKHDLFYYRSKDDKFHSGMHHLTNNIILTKNKPLKFKSVMLYSLSLINEGEKHSFYFDKEEQQNEWYMHLQKALSFRNIEDFYILGEKLKVEQTRILREVYLKKDEDMHHLNTINNKSINNYSTKNNSKINSLLCTQIIKPSNNLIRQINDALFYQLAVFRIPNHPNLCKLYDIFQDEKYLYLITEKCTGDNILQYLRVLDIHNPYKEEEKICEIIHQLLMVIYYLHKFGIVHRNIKPDSVLMYKRGIDSSIKLIDFSLSKYLNNNEKTKEPYGTVGYSSPEMLLDLPYDSKIDEWSIGILTYLLLCGKLPFSDEHSEREVARQTIHEKLSFTQPIWEKKSIEAKDFVNRLLNKDPKKRMSVKEALVHPWIQNHFPSAVEERLKKNYNHEGEIIEFEKFSSFINNK